MFYHDMSIRFSYVTLPLQHHSFLTMFVFNSRWARWNGLWKWKSIKNYEHLFSFVPDCHYIQ